MKDCESVTLVLAPYLGSETFLSTSHSPLNYISPLFKPVRARKREREREREREERERRERERERERERAIEDPRRFKLNLGYFIPTALGPHPSDAFQVSKLHTFFFHAHSSCRK